MLCAHQNVTTEGEIFVQGELGENFSTMNS